MTGCRPADRNTDLLPALEQARAAGKRVEVAAWKPDEGYAGRLSLPAMWCHHLTRADHQRVADPTDDTRLAAEPPSGNSVVIQRNGGRRVLAAPGEAYTSNGGRRIASWPK